MQDFIKKLQSASHEDKKRWLIIFSSISMVIIIILWIVYANMFVFKQVGDNTEEQVDVGVWQVFKKGFVATIKPLEEKTKDLMTYTFSKLPVVGEKKNITIENPN